MGGVEEDESCVREDDDLPTAPSEQPTSAQGAHQETAPPTAGGEQRSRSDGGGSLPDLDSAPHQTQRNRSLTGVDSMTRFTGTNGVSHDPKNEGTHTHTQPVPNLLSCGATGYVKNNITLIPI